jgi:DNA (cytosine-5)-methyltransferase 1
MENVKGLLSSAVDGERVFEQVLADLSKVGNGSYKFVPLTPRSDQTFFGSISHPPAFDFVVRAEDHGIPQSRHRVIIVGIRADIAEGLEESQIGAALLPRSEVPVRVRDVLKGMPKLRSGLSGGDDSEEIWRSRTARIMRDVSKAAVGLSNEAKIAFRDLGTSVAVGLSVAARVYRRSGGPYAGVPASCPDDLKQWLVDPRLIRCKMRILPD